MTEFEENWICLRVEDANAPILFLACDNESGMEGSIVSD